jgi:hypothetical protein
MPTWQEWRDSNPQPPVLECGKRRAVQCRRMQIGSDLRTFAQSVFMLRIRPLHYVLKRLGPILGPRNRRPPPLRDVWPTTHLTPTLLRRLSKP